MLETMNENCQDQNKEVEVEPKCSKNAKTKKSFGLDFLTYILEGEPRTFIGTVNSIEGLFVERGH